MTITFEVRWCHEKMKIMLVLEFKFPHPLYLKITRICTMNIGTNWKSHYTNKKRVEERATSTTILDTYLSQVQAFQKWKLLCSWFKRETWWKIFRELEDQDSHTTHVARPVAPTRFSVASSIFITMVLAMFLGLPAAFMAVNHQRAKVWSAGEYLCFRDNEETFFPPV